ncbi:MAG: radical SAM protein [Agathobacter sp.]|nr:radical SAM protein [Agathobacter sp.]
MEPMADASSVERVLLNQARAKNIPMNGSIELLPLCNLNCKMCYVRLSREEMEAQGRIREVSEWLDIARQMKDNGVLFLLLTGGEPLMYPGFKELFVALKKMGMILTINTNGTLLDEEWAQFFAENKPRRINITVYGSNEETYRELCRAPKGFEQATNAIRLLKEKGVDVKVAGSATRANAAEIEDIIKLAHEMNVPAVIDTYMMPAVRERSLPYDHQARLDPLEAARVRVRSLELEMTKETFKQYRQMMIDQVDNFVPGEEKEEGIGCMAGNCSFSVNWQGNLQPCVILSHINANVFEVGFKNAWNYVLEGAKELKTSSKCSVCSLRPLCRTCVAAGITEEGEANLVPHYMCEYAKETLRLLREWKEEPEGENVNE